MPTNTMEYFQSRLNEGHIVQCPVCDSYNAYAWEDVNMDSNTGLRLIPQDGLMDGGVEYTEDEYLPAWPDVYHVSATNAFYWRCGNCKNYIAPVDSMEVDNG